MRNWHFEEEDKVNKKTETLYFQALKCYICIYGCMITLNGVVDIIFAVHAPNKSGLACIAKGQKEFAGWIRI